MQQWTATQTEPGIWVFTWTPTAGRIYEVWLYGVLLYTTVAGAGTYTTDYTTTDEPPQLEIHDTADGDAQNEAYPPFSWLQWRGIAAASGYNVEYYDGSAWVVVGFMQETAAGWYMFKTAILEDQTAAQYQVTALDDRGLGGTAVEFTIELVTNPLPPAVTIDVDGGTITVGAA